MKNIQLSWTKLLSYYKIKLNYKNAKSWFYEFTSCQSKRSI